VKRFALGSILLLIGAVSALAQQPSTDSAAQGSVFRSGTNLVSLNITVRDQSNKNFVNGLTQADFAIYEDGVRQQVQFFESRSVPIDLIVLLDTSSSMQDKIKEVHQAAIGFLSTLREGDRGAVVAFNDNVEIVKELTGDLASLEAAVRSTRAKGATSLHNALYIALKQFGKLARHNDEVRRQAIAVLSDGQDTSSLISFEDVLNVARKSGVSIYTIGLQSKYVSARLAASGQRRYFSDSEYSLKMLAAETGAQSFFPLDVRELKTVYASIAEELSSQYSLAYAPANPRADGRFRRIIVQIASHPELRPRTRTGYTAEGVRVSSSINPQTPR
jgi:Ca-activated chloride channel family protein